MNFLSSEFACFVAEEIIQVIEAMPGSVVPLAMFGSFALKFAFFAHFMYSRSTICYDVRAFSLGKFIWKEL